MPFIAATFDTERPEKRRMTTLDWWDAGIAITWVLAGVAVGYLLVLGWR